jgi:hypothetical protein
MIYMDGFLPDSNGGDPVVGKTLDYTSKPIKAIVGKAPVDNKTPTPNVDGTITFNGKWVVQTGDVNAAMMAMSRILSSA